MTSPGKSLLVAFSILFFVSILLPAPAFCDEKPIAHLTDFSGTVLIKSRGEWAVKPVKNLPLYSQDKVFTRIGTATIMFTEGATVVIKNNSNLLIREIEKEKGVIKKVKIVNRRILLLMGKMFFKSGTGQVQTQFETEKTVIGIRGTECVLSIDQLGETYILFTEGAAERWVGDPRFGEIAIDVPTSQADINPFQNAAYQAHNAYKKYLEAEIRFENGEISEAQRDWFLAKAKEMDAQEAITWATPLLNHPDGEVSGWATEIIEAANTAKENALQLQNNAIDRDAVPDDTLPDDAGPVGAEGYTPPDWEIIYTDPSLIDTEYWDRYDNLNQ